MKNKTFEVRESKFAKDRIELGGSRYLIANGFMGYRGTLDEYRKAQLTALNMAGLFDLSGDGGWRESVNAPNPLYTCVYAGKNALSVLENAPKKHTQALDIRYGIHTRSTTFEIEGINYTVKSERFVSMDNENVCAVRFCVTSDADTKVKIITGIDTDIWDINGKHLNMKDVFADTLDGASFETAQLQIPLVCFESVEGFKNKGLKNGIITNEKTVTLKAGEAFSFDKICGVYWGKSAKTARAKFEKAVALGYDKLLEKHKKVWDEIWYNSDVVIEGDDRAQLAMRYSIYHLSSIVPRHTDKCGIPARGLSGQVYKGASFWDTEMFMLPFFDFTDAKLAKNLTRYRINTIGGAKRKAKEYGYDGAFFAWESQETGDDACTHFNITDIFTKRPMRTYFRDKQIHVSADMVYGLWEYCRVTGDYSLLLKGGIDLIYECLLFFYSFSHFKKSKDRYELIDVVGPDEYHERVNNNAFTNRMVKYTADTFIAALDKVKEADKAAYDKFMKSHDTSFVLEFAEKLYVPAPDKKNIIEQFDGYYKLEDVSLEEIRKRVIEPNEYWGGGHGIAATTRILKQADIVMMLNVFRAEYSKVVKKACWEFYEPYTEHGSSLSACAYAIVAASIGKSDWAYKYFLKTAEVDLLGATRQYLGLLYIGGTHPAANGGSWNTAVFGFGGVSYTDDALDISPSLPSNWSGLSFKLLYKGVRFDIAITKKGTTVTPEGDASGINITVNGKPCRF